MKCVNKTFDLRVFEWIGLGGNHLVGPYDFEQTELRNSVIKMELTV